MADTKQVPASAVLVNPPPVSSAFAIPDETNKPKVDIGVCNNATIDVQKDCSVDVVQDSAPIENPEAKVVLIPHLDHDLESKRGRLATFEGPSELCHASTNVEMARTESSGESMDIKENVLHAEEDLSDELRDSPPPCRKRKLADADLVTSKASVVRTPMLKKSHLSSNLLQKVTSIVQRSGDPGRGNVKEARFTEKQFSEVDKATVSPSCSSIDDTRMMDGDVKSKKPIAKAGSESSDESCDISLLFSKTFDKSYKRYEKSAKVKRKKKQKKGTSECDDDGKTAQKPRPNYFLSIQVTNPNVHRGIEFVQQQIVGVHRQLRRALISLPTLHLTLSVFHLDNNDEQQLERAQVALQSCVDKLAVYREHPIQFAVSGISHFRGAVIYADLVKDEALEKIEDMAEVVVDALKRHQVVPPEHNADFTPHLTLLKLSKVKRWKRGEKRIYKVPASAYEPFLKQSFGRQTVRSVQLCAMLKKKPATGYYHVDHQVDLVAADSPLDETGEMPTDYLTSADIERYRAQMMDQRCSPTVFMAEFEKRLEWRFHPSPVESSDDAPAVSPPGGATSKDE